MNEYCTECGDRIRDQDFAVKATLYGVTDMPGSDDVLHSSNFSDWYCFDCYPGGSDD